MTSHGSCAASQMVFIQYVMHNESTLMLCWCKKWLTCKNATRLYRSTRILEYFRPASGYGETFRGEWMVRCSHALHGLRYMERKGWRLKSFLAVEQHVYSQDFYNCLVKWEHSLLRCQCTLQTADHHGLRPRHPGLPPAPHLTEEMVLTTLAGQTWFNLIV